MTNRRFQQGYEKAQQVFDLFHAMEEKKNRHRKRKSVLVKVLLVALACILWIAVVASVHPALN